MFRINYRPSELSPSHQRNFPPAEERRGAGSSNDGSWQLALMVGLYLVAMGAGLALLSRFSTTIPNTVTAEIMASH